MKNADENALFDSGLQDHRNSSSISFSTHLSVKPKAALATRGLLISSFFILASHCFLGSIREYMTSFSSPQVCFGFSHFYLFSSDWKSTREQPWYCDHSVDVPLFLTAVVLLVLLGFVVLFWFCFRLCVKREVKSDSPPEILSVFYFPYLPMPHGGRHHGHVFLPSSVAQLQD